MKKEKIKIILRNIQKKYIQLFDKKLSHMTISRILRKTKVKNPKLEKNQYLFMKHFFIKGTSRAIEQELKFIFLDDSGFQ